MNEFTIQGKDHMNQVKGEITRAAKKSFKNIVKNITTICLDKSSVASDHKFEKS